MNKLVPLLAALVLVTATPVLADRDSAPHNSSSLNTQAQVGCDPAAAWPNHGAYVSCVAHEHLGGTSVSEAAESNIGRHHGEESSESASPEPPESPTSSPSASPSGTASPSATVSASVMQSTSIELQTLIQVLDNILNSLKNLL